MTSDPSPALTDAVFERPETHGGRPLVGIFPGEGIGPEVLAAALDVLSAVEPHCPVPFERQSGPADSPAGTLTPEAIAFHSDIFERGGAVLSGPAAGRFVYDLRRRFDLFCKLVPIQGHPELADASPLKSDALEGVDLVLVRENVGGIYQGDWELRGDGSARRAEHRFVYEAIHVERIVQVAARLAQRRRGELGVIIKDGGAPAVSDLWREVAGAVARSAGLRCRFLNIDLAAYEIVRNPRSLDVIVAPNLFGDVLADIGSLFTGSRGASFSGNFAAAGAAVYQTNHGAALDLAGADQANPIGQILALAMMLRESFRLFEPAAAIERAVRRVWREGWRTADVAGPSSRVVGTRELGRRVAEAAARALDAAHHRA